MPRPGGGAANSGADFGGRSQHTDEVNRLEDWSKTAALVGMGIVGRKQDVSDGSIVLEVEVFPGMPRDEVPFRQINGQWKIAGRF